jgi:hypothetical protein
VYTIGRSTSPFRFNPLIPPDDCELGTWIKLIVDVIAPAYLGGEGVISLLVSGLHHLYGNAGVFDGTVRQWPVIPDLLAWRRTVNLRGRAAMWQASAERILVAMTYGEFGAVLNTQGKALHPDNIENGVIERIAALASHDHGDARKAVAVVAKSVYLAEKAGTKLTPEVVGGAMDELHCDRYVAQLRTAPVQLKAAMASTIDASRQAKGRAVGTGEAYDACRRFCDRAGLIGQLGVLAATHRSTSPVCRNRDGLLRSTPTRYNALNVFYAS